MNERHSTEMPIELWQALTRLAAETNSLANSGSRRGKPSWRSLLRRIAEGKIKLLETENKEVIQ